MSRIVNSFFLRSREKLFVMRRASEAGLFFFGFPRKKKPLHNGSYEHRLPKKQTLFCTRDVCVCDSGMCV